MVTDFYLEYEDKVVLYCENKYDIDEELIRSFRNEIYVCSLNNRSVPYGAAKVAELIFHS